MVWCDALSNKLWLRGNRDGCDGSSDRSFMVDPLSHFSFQPVIHDWCNKGSGTYVLSCLYDDAYKITLAANRKE